MALRYRQRYPQSGDILNPDDWNLNHKELAEEFNGYLDRDNLPQNCIGTDIVKNNSFTNVRNETSDTDLDTTSNTVEWQEILSKSFDTRNDQLLKVELGVTWTVDPEETSEKANSRFRITVDGVQLAVSGIMSSAFKQDSVYLCGATPVLAGPHVVAAEVQTLYGDGSVNSQGFVASLGVIRIKERELVITQRNR
jgi:hypothetical protein